MKKVEILNAIIYPSLMIPFMGFIAIQVYQINAISSVNHAVISANSVRITVNERNIITHLINHSGSSKSLNLAFPMISMSDRRKNPRLEVTK